MKLLVAGKWVAGKLLAGILLIGVFALPSHAQVAVTASVDHQALLASHDSKLATNKKLVYDFWREVFEAGHLELAEKYLAEDYIQHNPNVATGRDAFVKFFGAIKKPKPIEGKVTAPLVNIVAEGDIVVLTFVREYKEPKDAAKTYTTTWFDMFRIANGKIAEHWDPAQKL